MSSKIKWEDANYAWDDNSYTWDEIALVVEAVSGPPGEGDDFIHPFFDKDPENKKKLVKLICKVQGKTIEKNKEIKDYKITVKDIQLLAEEVLGINVKVL